MQHFKRNRIWKLRLRLTRSLEPHWETNWCSSENVKVKLLWSWSSQVSARGSHHGPIFSSQHCETLWSGYRWTTCEFALGKKGAISLFKVWPYLCYTQTMIVLELMPKGDLKTYLRRLKPRFVNVYTTTLGHPMYIQLATVGGTILPYVLTIAVHISLYLTNIEWLFNSL